MQLRDFEKAQRLHTEHDALAGFLAAAKAKKAFGTHHQARVELLQVRDEDRINPDSGDDRVLAQVLGLPLDLVLYAVHTRLKAVVRLLADIGVQADSPDPL
jgi:hypothetical protein